ncbi:DUF1543 domain-containing protein [Sediminibacterium roseum]|uniref:DUF1543 domain-containing protein n=1 Tax=Sediminibacterium roseum TaxID=1978412 RepID=A0ABX0A125_9BACT|nr:DUF1543 domain-containing protein [Sediminibacterium roseum]NCI51642.1 DUF1543 domain-containing protein [Sediminibacterium roseum]
METKLFMLLLGCKPQGRYTEQHDVFFGAGAALKDLLPGIHAFWPGPHKIHIDAWREVTEVDGFRISLVPKKEQGEKKWQLFFINLGGYKQHEFEEYHYKMLVVAEDKAGAIKQAKASAFYKHTGFKGADSHIDDKYGVDVDDLYEIEEILDAGIKEKYSIRIEEHFSGAKDEWVLGYTKLSSLV